MTIKIDRETCPVNTRIILRYGDHLFEFRITEWSPGGLVCVRACRDNAVPGWYTAEELEARVVEILPADPAVPALPGPWLEAWPSEIPDGSVWEYESKLWGAVRFVAMDGELGNPNEDVWLCQGAFNLETDNRIRRVG